MKRSFDKIISSEDEMIVDIPDKLSKKHQDEHVNSTGVELMDYSDKPSTSADDIAFFKDLHQHGRPTLVERESHHVGYSLLSVDYVGKKDCGVLTDLQACFKNAVDFTEANVRNRIDMIGQQMKYLQDSLCNIVNKAKQDSELHSAACNFVKKSGNTYHLYERPSGQKYFSMLSPIDWSDSPPHKFLGSWYLEADQSWTSAEEMHLRYPGITFLKQMYMGKKSIQ